MKCHACGAQVGQGARFCGICGISLVSGDTSAKDSNSHSMAGAWQELSEGLVGLAQTLRGKGFAPFILEAIEKLAVGPQPGAHLTALVGEKGRGKTTLLNRLLGASVLPTGRQGMKQPVRVHWDATWHAKTAHGPKPMDEALTLEAAPNLQEVAGPALILRTTDLLDTPALNEVGLDFEERLLSELVHADAFLICIASNQMLSQSERDLIRQRLLPLLGGEGALVVTHTDLINTQEDWDNILGRATRFAGNRLAVLCLPQDPSSPPTEVLNFLARSVERRGTESTQAWRRKVAALLRGINQSLDSDMPVEAVPVSETDRAGRLSSLKRLIESEHNLAVSEAVALLRQQLEELRSGLTSRVSRWTPEYAQHEGATEIAAEVQSIMQAAAHCYVSNLEQSLTSSAPRSIQLAAEGLHEIVPSLGSIAIQPATVEPQRKQEPPVPALAKTGIGMFLLSSRVGLIACTAALMCYRKLRQTDEASFQRQVALDAAKTLSEWVSSMESSAVDQLNQSTRQIANDLGSRLESAIWAGEPATSIPPGTDLRGEIERCLNLASDPTGSSPDHEVKV